MTALAAAQDAELPDESAGSGRFDLPSKVVSIGQRHEERCFDPSFGRCYSSDAVDQGALEARFREAVNQDANVEMHLKADRATRYEAVAETMSAARRAGLTKIGFVTQPGNEM